jgi:hypothetical protein
MGTKGGVPKDRSVGPVRTQVRYRGWGRRRGLRAYNRPETTPPGGRKTLINSLYFLEGTGTPPSPGRQPAPERRGVMLRAGSPRQASLRKTDAVNVRENPSSGPAKPGKPLEEWIRIHSSRLFPSRSTRPCSYFSFSPY